MKFAWARRLFGYWAVLMAAVTIDPDDTHARASQSAEISITAARSFNRALGTIHFAVASTWTLGPVALLLAILYQCEFASHVRGVLLKLPPNTRS